MNLVLGYQVSSKTPTCYGVFAYHNYRDSTSRDTIKLYRDRTHEHCQRIQQHFELRQVANRHGYCKLGDPRVKSIPGSRLDRFSTDCERNERRGRNILIRHCQSTGK